MWTCADACGIERLPLRAVRTAVDACGHGLEIYGSEGWGFEFSRACKRNPRNAGVSRVCSRGSICSMETGFSTARCAVVG